MLARCGTYVHVAPFYYYVHHSITLVASIFIVFEHRYLVCFFFCPSPILRWRNKRMTQAGGDPA